MKIKSSHKIRKTYASNLDAAGVPLEDIRKALGHSSSQTTLKYLFSVHTEREKHKRFEEALSL